MDKNEIRKILKYPSLEIVNLALDYVNLTEKERRVIELTELKGYTEERGAEILDISVRNLQMIKAKSFEKIDFVWSNNLLIKIISNN